MSRPAHRRRGLIPQIRIFECIDCGAHTPATKWKGRTMPGHVKTMYCFRCRRMTDHAQIE